MSNIIQINNLNKSFGSVTAVQNLSFRVKKGELFAFLGINGAGKSTTINIMCGQLSKDSGSVFIDKHDLDKDMDYIKRELGVVFQSSVLDSALSVYDNLESRAALYGITGMEFKKRLEELAKILDFENLLKRTVGKLSGGQRRRIDIARALFHKPKILILDEPTAGLDPKERVRFRNLISAFSKDRIVILSTHIVSDVEFIAEDIIMMKDGQILHFGKTQEITTEIDGQVWECTVPTSRAEQYSETLNISNLRNIENNCTVLRVISEQSPMENAIKVEPTLEDLYLFYFKGVNE